MNTIAKLSALMVTSVALAVTTGCATKRNNTSEVVVAPMGVPGNAVYGTGVGLVNNSAGVVAAAYIDWLRQSQPVCFWSNHCSSCAH